MEYIVENVLSVIEIGIKIDISMHFFIKKFNNCDFGFQPSVSKQEMIQSCFS